MKKKVLFAINSDLYVRNYIETGIIKKLLKEKKFSVKLIFHQSLKKKITKYKFKNLSYFNSSSSSLIKYQRFLNAVMWRHQNKCKSFEFRAKQFTFTLRSFKKFTIFKNFSSRVKFFILNFILSKNPIWFFFLRFNLSTNINQSLIKIINNFKPDIIIYPTQAYELVGRDICLIGKEKKIKTFFLVDNWDNLSSKSIMFEKPDILGVWSKQTKKHAINIQGFKKENVKIIGTPRFEKYYTKKIKNNKFNFKYFLFLGQALTFDEANIVYNLDSFISDYFQGEYKMIYRPHPWRQNEDTVNHKKLKNTIIDPQVFNQYSKKNKSINFQPDLNYYPSLLKNSQFIISGLTTMLLEGSILKKKILVLAFDDMVSDISQFDVLKQMEHLQGIEKLNNLKICKNYDDLINDFIYTFHNKKFLGKKFNKQLNYFITNKNYYQELKKII